jgi:hypothetical protein
MLRRALAVGAGSVSVNATWTDWAGPEAMLRHMKIRLGAPAIPGHPLRFTGRVAATRDEGDERVIEVEVRLANDLGDHATGTVQLALPL